MQRWKKKQFAYKQSREGTYNTTIFMQCALLRPINHNTVLVKKKILKTQYDKLTALDLDV